MEAHMHVPTVAGRGQQYGSCEIRTQISPGNAAETDKLLCFIV
jgi:hypothetical protein